MVDAALSTFTSDEGREVIFNNLGPECISRAFQVRPASAWRPAWPTRWITYSFKNFLTGEGDIKSVGNQGR